MHISGFKMTMMGIALSPSLLLSGSLDPWLLQQELLQGNNIPTTQQTGYDLNSDSSFHKFLDDTHPFENLSYQPIDLIPIPSDFSWNNARRFLLRQEAAEQFADMAWHFWDWSKGKKRLSLTSTYRSYKHQELLKKSCSKTRCAKAGTSEHQAGLALDLGINGGRMGGEGLSWLQENAHKWGFHQTYQKGIQIDGKAIEPWHWRYLGTGLATELWEKNMSFAEWFYLNADSNSNI